MSMAVDPKSYLNGSSIDYTYFQAFGFYQILITDYRTPITGYCHLLPCQVSLFSRSFSNFTRI